MDRVFCYHIVVMLFACIALSFIVVSVTTPGWLVVTFQEQEAKREFTVDSLNRSLFYDVLCPQELRDCRSCQSGDTNECVDNVNSLAYKQHFTWIERLTVDKEEWVAWRIMMAIVLVCALVGFILVLVLVCCLLSPSVYKIVCTTGFIFWLIAGLLVWAPVGMVADMHLDIDDTVNANVISPIDNINHDATLHVPYSVVLAAIGGFVALLVALMLLCLTGVCSRRDDGSSTSSGSQILSDRTKTVVQGGLYYGPQPYYPPERPVYYREPQPEYYPGYVRSPETFVEPTYTTKERPTYWGTPVYDNRYGQRDYGYY